MTRMNDDEYRRKEKDYNYEARENLASILLHFVTLGKVRPSQPYRDYKAYSI